MNDLSIIQEVYDVIVDRKRNPREGSYVCSLLNDAKGKDRILEKIGEESSELIIAAKNGDKKEITHESVDLIFHTLILTAVSDIPLQDLLDEFKRRRK
jgi:phosphoribosyl-ATP pyrophosphohydrolase